MSLTLVRAYFIDVMNDLGYDEHQDAFNDANIASSELDKGFHVLINAGSAIKTGHQHQEINCNVEVKFFFKGFRDTLQSMTDALTEIDSVIAEAMNVPVRKASLDSGLRNVKFVDFNIDPIGEANDNVVKVTIRFQGVVLYLINATA